jgi:hypothetical protein
LQLDALVDIDLADGMGHLLSRDRLTVYFKRREREKAKALIDAWKAEGVYRRCQAEIPLIVLFRFPGPALVF